MREGVPACRKWLSVSSAPHRLNGFKPFQFRLQRAFAASRHWRVPEGHGGPAGPLDLAAPATGGSHHTRRPAVRRGVHRACGADRPAVHFPAAARGWRAGWQRVAAAVGGTARPVTPRRADHPPSDFIGTLECAPVWRTRARACIGDACHGARSLGHRRHALLVVAPASWERQLWAGYLPLPEPTFRPHPRPGNTAVKACTPIADRGATGWFEGGCQRQQVDGQLRKEKKIAVGNCTGDSGRSRLGRVPWFGGCQSCHAPVHSRHGVCTSTQGSNCGQQSMVCDAGRRSAVLNGVQ